MKCNGWHSRREARAGVGSLCLETSRSADQQGEGALCSMEAARKATNIVSKCHGRCFFCVSVFVCVALSFFFSSFLRSFLCVFFPSFHCGQHGLKPAIGAQLPSSYLRSHCPTPVPDCRVLVRATLLPPPFFFSTLPFPPFLPPLPTRHFPKQASLLLCLRPNRLVQRCIPPCAFLARPL
jgi:hypothetical protein